MGLSTSDIQEKQEKSWFGYFQATKACGSEEIRMTACCFLFEDKKCTDGSVLSGDHVCRDLDSYSMKDTFPGGENMCSDTVQTCNFESGLIMRSVRALDILCGV